MSNKQVIVLDGKLGPIKSIKKLQKAGQVLHWPV